MSAPYPLVHSHLLLQRLISLSKPKSLAPAFHCEYSVQETPKPLAELIISVHRCVLDRRDDAGERKLVPAWSPNLSRTAQLYNPPLLTPQTRPQCRHDTDRELPFRQESNFAWLSGCDVPGSALTIAYEHEGGADIDPSKVQTRLWLPEIDDAEVMWCGLPPAPEELDKMLHLTSIQRGWTPPALYPPKPTNGSLPTMIHTLPNVRPPSSVLASINGPTHSTDYLLKALHEARRNKTSKEVELLRKASEITGSAHRELMRLVGAKAINSENEAEAEFVATCTKKGYVVGL